MKPALLPYLVCPECGSGLECAIHRQEPARLSDAELAVLRARGADLEAYQTEILTGRLACTSCSAGFPIFEGVPRIYKDAEKDFPVSSPEGLSTDGLAVNKDDRHVQSTFSREWEEFDYEDQTIWHWTLDQRVAIFCEELAIDSPEQLRGKVMVDGGCGPAILSMNLSHRHQIEIIGMDLSFVLSRAFKANKSNLCHFIQASVLAPPLRHDFADVTYSHGVLHHTSDTHAAFNAIATLTRPGGLLYVWLYGRKKGWNRIKYGGIRTIRALVSRLPRYPQMAVIYVLVLVHMVIRGFKRLTGQTVEPIENLNQMFLVTRDRYTPKHAREHTEAEVKGWFAENGFSGMVRRTQWTTVDVWNGSTDLAIRGIRSVQPGARKG